jgi:ABC-2 type transport system ATP-binding protein
MKVIDFPQNQKLLKSIIKMDNIIEVKNLTKNFNKFTAVDNISFNVKRGEVFAFLGPNGAGKTTTIKMLITLLKPTGGGGIIDGYDFVHRPAKVRRVIGYVPQMISVDGALTAYENLVLMGRLYDIPSAELHERIQNILSFLKLEEYANSLVRNFSGGMIRKLEIGQAVLHRPRVLFLDEPTLGLDPVARQNVWHHLLGLRNVFDTTIFFTTHYMEEAEATSNRVAIMHNGKIAAIGSVSELKEKTNIKNVTLENAFIFFTGDKIQESGDIRETKKTRKIAGELK